jgi:hypothetical protein
LDDPPGYDSLQLLPATRYKIRLEAMVFFIPGGVAGRFSIHLALVSLDENRKALTIGWVIAMQFSYLRDSTEEKPK